MINPFCIKRDQLVKIFYQGVSRERFIDVLNKFGHKYSKEEILLQTEIQQGEVGEYIKNENKKFGKNTANAEIVTAITLADLYFLESEPSICFEMKKDFTQKEISNYRELTENLESYTEIDCLIKDEKKGFKFQLKLYPEEYKEWSVEKVIQYMEDSILPKYSSESNKDLIIGIVIQPETGSAFQEEDFKKIHEYLVNKEIKLAEIHFLYNRNIKQLMWHQVFPENGYYAIPWEKLSYHKAKNIT